MNTTLENTALFLYTFFISLKVNMVQEIEFIDRNSFIDNMKLLSNAS